MASKSPRSRSNNPKSNKAPLNGATDLASLWDGIPIPTGPLKDRIEHIDQLLQKGRKRGELPTAKSLALDFAVDEKTVRKTIKTMQDLYGMPIEYNAQRHGYEYTEDVAFLPFLQLTESELVAMYLAQQLGVFEGTPFKPRLKTAFRKMLGLFGGKLSFDPALLDECFSFDESGPHARFRPEHLDACSRAMLRQEELVLTYTKQNGVGAGVPEERRVWPLHITYRDFAYYALCHDLKRGEIRTFMVTRMNEVKETGVKFQRPAEYDARAHLDKAFKVFASEETTRVVLEFAPDAAKRVEERRWHSTQRFKKLPGGRLEMTMDVGLAPDLYAWIGGFFGGCRVVEPGELRETMVKLFLEGTAAQAASTSNVQL